MRLDDDPSFGQFYCNCNAESKMYIGLECITNVIFRIYEI